MALDNSDMWSEAQSEYKKWNRENKAFRYMRGGRLIDFEDLPITERNKWMKIVLMRKQSEQDIISRREKKERTWKKLEKEK